LDEKTRGFIESAMDKMMKEEIVGDVGWVPEEIPISSLAELALEYTIGIFRAAAWAVVQLVSPRSLSEATEEQEEKVIRAMIKRRLPEIVKKINMELNR